MRVRSKKTGRILDEIRLRDFVVPCTIGIYPEEKLKTQPLHLQLVMYLDTSLAAKSGQLCQSVDYSSLVKEVSFILTQGHFRLIESAAEAVAAFILAPHPVDVLRGSCDAVEVEIVKPEALRGLSIPSIRIFREQGESIAAKGVPTWDMIFAAPETSLFRGIVPPQTSLRPWLPGWNVTAVMTGGAGLRIADRSLTAAEELHGDQLAEHFLNNETDEPRSFLALARRDPKTRPHAGSAASLSLLQSSML
ncbi:MAG TPA: dihydroneopterin aldolase [Oligoflexus sp.]|uniref:dihydroneopterin aldolase n=1 Tax=Oligoflexus sp. TaxID=1971216 RepID=UPI002D7F60F6|nr:dihydroneopterin aldolase [Oligoflexus sp.]HET9240212.1 dihydroneopterin aldolase [Oligoflexus sp.]